MDGRHLAILLFLVHLCLGKRQLTGAFDAVQCARSGEREENAVLRREKAEKLNHKKSTHNSLAREPKQMLHKRN